MTVRRSCIFFKRAPLLPLSNVRRHGRLHGGRYGTDHLRTNFKNYPRNSVLKEMLQNNADDAGADSFVVLYDKRYHPKDNLLVYHVSMDDEDMRRDLQGPALLVQNNDVMKDKDIQAIREVSQPSKKGNHSARLQLCVSYQKIHRLSSQGIRCIL